MNKLVVLFLFFLLLPLSCFSQTEQLGKSLSLKEMDNLIKNDPQAYSYIKEAKIHNIFSLVFYSLGGVLLEGFMVQSFDKDKNQWLLLGLSGACMVIAVPFTISSSHKTNKAIRVYNENLQLRESQRSDYSLNMTVSPNSVGIKVSF